MTQKARMRGLVGAGVLVAGIVAAGCSGGDTYDEFRSAVESGASCAELFDQRSNFDRAGELERIDADLERIGCETRDSDRAAE